MIHGDHTTCGFRFAGRGPGSGNDSDLGAEGEAKTNEVGVTVRCPMRPCSSVPDPEDNPTSWRFWLVPANSRLRVPAIISSRARPSPAQNCQI
jgi:hypothetical protein